MFDDIKLSKALSRLNLSFSVENIYIKTYWCRIAVREIKTFMSKTHAHSFFEIHLCIKGRATFVVGNEKVSVKEGEFIFIPQKTPHRIEKISDDFIKLVWGFDVTEEGKNGEGYNDFLVIKKLTRYSVSAYTTDVLAELSLLLRNVDEKKIGWYSTVKRHLYGIFVEIARCLIETNDLSVERDKGEHKIRIDAIASYIADNMANGITITELAREFSVSERQLSRICNREYGMPAGEYIRSLQMAEAKRLLENLELSVSGVANMTGYSDYYAFCKAFKRVEGLSPAKFRDSLLK